jgi:hypothetical protein
MDTGFAMATVFARIPLSTSGIMVRHGEHILDCHLLLLPMSSPDGMDGLTPYAQHPVDLYIVPVSPIEE